MGGCTVNNTTSIPEICHHDVCREPDHFCAAKWTAWVECSKFAKNANTMTEGGPECSSGNSAIQIQLQAAVFISCLLPGVSSPKIPGTSVRELLRKGQA
ncbi:unnamed protein product [Chondrus crispus]|uniref:Uncharacterized protein n=1 Tax=Chondrus crispus TaxID=2769 RepID=R7QDK7_CHOCR|nr:unnamed protein product [Chondrus crispus]CDF35516.1 unnamed protein product [Chondrus crispus]|eukprot:XP_005715335.1 unnamed protein product [Chondrus crispus]